MVKISKEQQDFINEKMFSAITNSDMPLLILCFTKGANPQAKNRSSRTALMAAVSLGRVEMTELLLQKMKDPAELFLKDANYDTAFTLAEKLSDKKIINMLLNALPNADTEPEEKPEPKPADPIRIPTPDKPSIVVKKPSSSSFGL